MTILDALETIAESGIRCGALCITLESDEAVDAVYAQLGVPVQSSRDAIQRPTYEDQDKHGGYRRVARTSILGLSVILQGPLKLRRGKEAA